MNKKNPAFQKTGVNVPNGLICLKGGDLKTEIRESKSSPKMWDVHEIFSEEYFEGKFMLHVGQ